MSLQLLQRTATSSRLLEDLAPDEAKEETPHRRLLCGRCYHGITSQAETITVDGRSVHRRINPAGFGFTFGCFQRAPGAVLHGMPTREHTWFSGYTWVYALCGGCSAHLGWGFEAGERRPFHGLILDRLTEEPSG